MIVGDYVETNCPFTKGEALEAMSSSSDRLMPGMAYKISEIQDGSYVLVEGYTHLGGGLYWSEFSKHT